VAFFVFSFALFGQIVYLLPTKKGVISQIKVQWYQKKWVVILETLMIIIVFVIFIVILHTKISPLFLSFPLHQCIFCLLQKFPVALLSFIMIFIGLNLLLIYFWITCSREYRDVQVMVKEELVKLLKWSGYMLIGGLGILLAGMLSR
jgi:hypothetical protein